MNIHALPAEEVITTFQSSKTGLSSWNASEILKKVGKNILTQTKKRTIFAMVSEQLKSTLVIILIIAALLSWYLEKTYIDTIVIMVIVVINTAIGVIQEFKTEQTLEHLKSLLTPQARVLRDWEMQCISSVDVVPWDILLLDEGERIVADARIIESVWLRVNQSILTWESVSQEKTTQVITENTPLSDRTNMIYQGTAVAAGSGKAIVIGTGVNTELWHISGMVGQIQEEMNPFSQKLEDFSRKVAIFIGVLCLLIVVILVSEHGKFWHSLLVAVSLAVSAIPEWLPAVVALSLALATKRLVKKNVLVRKLPSSETLGRVTVICTDKTGTLTKSEMQVVDVYSNGSIDTEKPHPILLDIAVGCNKAGYGKSTDGIERIFWDPTEIGLLEYAKLYNVDKKTFEDAHNVVAEFPFESDRKRMSIVRENNWKYRAYVKWAPERILELTTHECINGDIQKINEQRKNELFSIYAKLASEWKRVLGMAYKDVEKQEKYTLEEIETHLVFAGFTAMMDPPRPEVTPAIHTCQEAGIRVIMITGDSELTASAVGKMIGLTGETIDATTLGNMTDEELAEKIKTINIFSRIAPQDKLRIVRILRTQGHIVAMTGDGVNDALALKQSDIGIAMWIRWTDVARDAADMVLTDDNFASIVAGVEEGRRVYDNTKKFIKYLLACNFYEVVLLAVCVIVYRDPLLVPFAALQILWINLVTDSLPALALSTQELEWDVMKRKPMNESLLAGIKEYVAFSGVIWLFVIGAIFFYFKPEGVELAQTMTVTSSIIYQMFLWLWSWREKRFDIRVNSWLIFALLASFGLHFLLIASPYAHIFGFTALRDMTALEWVAIFWLPFIGYILSEFSKKK